jgi:hypothetical protein
MPIFLPGSLLKKKLMDGISNQERIVIAEFYWVRVAI